MMLQMPSQRTRPAFTSPAEPPQRIFRLTLVPTTVGAVMCLSRSCLPRAISYIPAYLAAQHTTKDLESWWIHHTRCTLRAEPSQTIFQYPAAIFLRRICQCKARVRDAKMDS